jgi:hypothetical protein
MPKRLLVAMVLTTPGEAESLSRNLISEFSTVNVDNENTQQSGTIVPDGNHTDPRSVEQSEWRGSFPTDILAVVREIDLRELTGNLREPSEPIGNQDQLLRVSVAGAIFHQALVMVISDVFIFEQVTQ